MTGVIGIVLICFGLRSLYKYASRKRSIKRSRAWADSVISYLNEEISKTKISK